MIIDGRGELVWFQQLELPDVAANLRIQRFAGKRVLTWWQGGVTPFAFGLGEGVIADTSYRTLPRSRPVTATRWTSTSSSSRRRATRCSRSTRRSWCTCPARREGKLSLMMDAIVQQVDVRTGLVVWEWHAYGHIPLSQSTPRLRTRSPTTRTTSTRSSRWRTATSSISARDTSAIYKVDQASGRIVWTLGGKASTFRLGRGASSGSSTTRGCSRNGRISLFDDEAGPPR